MPLQIPFLLKQAELVLTKESSLFPYPKLCLQNSKCKFTKIRLSKYQLKIGISKAKANYNRAFFHPSIRDKNNTISITTFWEMITCVQFYFHIFRVTAQSYFCLSIASTALRRSDTNNMVSLVVGILFASIFLTAASSSGLLCTS